VSAGRASDRRSLVFIGFMGAGKTSAARIAAAALRARAVDSDEVIERRIGVPLEEYFSTHGERAFREIEEETIADLLDAPPSPVVSLGGGAIASERVRAALASHTVVWLDVDSDTAWQRAGGRRPLARDRGRFDALHAEREPLYERLADAMLPTSHRDVVRRALGDLRRLDQAPPDTKLLWATSASGDYPVYVGDGVLESGFWPVAGRRFLITDDAVGELYGAAVGETASALRVPPGEQSKTLAHAETLLRDLARAGMDHDDHVVALGGGVVGDLAGFCAAVYQRGVGVVQVPTTLVAQVDSAYGGKTGVDLPEAKNYVGAYHQPLAVMVDPRTLSTLPPREVAAGWAEVIKTALIAGGSLWKRVRHGEAPLDRDLVLACARTKLGVVAADERDDGRRQVLNLGHTVGHAIETVTGYSRYLHGEAVGLGLLAALTLSRRPELREEVADLLLAHGLPTRLGDGIDLEAVAVAVGRDKKRRAGRVGFVLVDGPGYVRVGCPVSDADLRTAIEELTR
jgi:shikimate kinase/3-dehydroquinate synthase